MISYIINVKKLSELIGTDRNQYSYTRLKNIMSGVVKRTRKGEIENIQKVLKTEFEKLDSELEKLKEEAF